MKLKTEIFLRKSARLLAWLIVIVIILAVLVGSLIALADNPVFQMLFISLLMLIALMGVLIFILWAIGHVNRNRIEELECLLHETEKVSKQ